MLGERVQQPAADDVERCARWLHDLERTRDLIAPLTGVDETACPDAALVRRFVDGLRGEMIAFREIVEGAAEVAALNADQLERIAANTADQSTVVERTASAIAESDQGAAHVAKMTDGLRALTGTLAGSTTQHDGGIDRVLGALTHLVSTVETAAGFAGAMESGSGEIRAFLDQLRRIARQARLLAINAAIEAAHLGQSGGGFVLVAPGGEQLPATPPGSARHVARSQRATHR